MQDTLVAGAGHCDEAAVRVLVYEAQQNIQKMVNIQVPFDRIDGQFLAHPRGRAYQNRILHSGGDATGLHMTKRLYEVVAQKENVTIVDNAFLADIVTGGGKVAGVIALDAQNQPCYYKKAPAW